MKGLYKVIKRALSAETCKLARDALVITKDTQYFINNIPESNTSAFGDEQCAHSFVNYGHSVCESLLLTVQPIVEKVTKKRLSPTYSYSRIYWKGATLEEHVDRPSCQYSVTLCLENNPLPWSIFMGGKEVTLDVGDLVIYKGMDIPHWRDPLEEDTQITQVFLHYVDLDGEHSEWALDKRPILGLVKNPY
jgi:hypothetical protein